jgi:hypothetical protein
VSEEERGAVPRRGAEPAGGEWISVRARWVVLLLVHVAALAAASLTHFPGRGGRTEAGLAADIALVGTLIAVAVSAVVVALIPRMPAVVARSARGLLIGGAVALLLGAAVGVSRPLLGESADAEVILRSVAVQAIGVVALLVLERAARRLMSASAGPRRSGESSPST